MSFFNPNRNVDERAPNASELVSAALLVRQAKQAFDFNVHLEKLAPFLVQTWKDNHPDATTHSKEDMNDCILAVTTELAIAAKDVGGSMSLAILTGGVSAAARALCKQVFSNDSGQGVAGASV